MEEKKQEIKSLKKEKNKNITLFVQLIILFLLVVLVRNFVFGSITVKGSSMEPTFSHGDFVLVNKLGYHFSEPKRGDIVICKRSDGDNLIKRVIGLPGDKIDFQLRPSENDFEYLFYVNGQLQDESYLSEPIREAGNLEYPYTVPENCYFVMGDNRNASTDSRTKSIGSIAKKDIEGRVFLQVLPFSKFGLVKGGIS